MAHYEQTRVAFDAAIFTVRDGTLHVLLLRRVTPPYAGMHELLGGLLITDETVEQTVARKCTQLLGATPHLEQFHTFTQPDRDPRVRTISIGFLGLVKDLPTGEWHPVDDLPRLAFDHARIVADAHAHLRERLRPQLLAPLLPPEFPLNQLQAVHEAITGEQEDNRNFRKRMLLDTVEETGSLERDVPHRPAMLYRFIRTRVRRPRPARTRRRS